jgi:hypothetical protein
MIDGAHVSKEPVTGFVPVDQKRLFVVRPQGPRLVPQRP